MVETKNYPNKDVTNELPQVDDPARTKPGKKRSHLEFKEYSEDSDLSSSYLNMLHVGSPGKSRGLTKAEKDIYRQEAK